MTHRPIDIRWLGRVDYAHGLELQAAAEARLRDANPRGRETETLLLLEHPPVLTLGRNAPESEILASRARLAAAGITVHQTNRGGRVTYHGPGQLTGYPVVDLAPDRKDVGHYVADLEQTLIATVANWGIAAGRFPGYTGVWVDSTDPGRLPDQLGGDGRVRRKERVPGATMTPPASVRKLGAIGIHLAHWITTHGFSLNVNTNLEAYDLIVPCGIRDFGLTSMAELLGHQVDIRAVANRFADEFCSRFGRTPIADARAM